MFRQLGLPAWVALYLVAIPLAIIVGVSVADPLAPTSLLALALIIGLGVAPIVLRFHHESLIIAWNSALVIFFLPGRPTLSMGLVGLCLMMAVVNRAMIRRPLVLPAASVIRPLIVLGVVVLVTAMVTGGIGGRAFGGEMWGARRYAGVIVGVAGFLALVSRQVPAQRAHFLAGAFVLSAVTSAFSDVAYAWRLDWLFLFFQTELAFLQAMSEQLGGVMRLTGVCWAAWAVFNFMLMRYGIEGHLQLRYPWRPVITSLAFLGTLLGGYRSYLVLAPLLVMILFMLEGLHRTKWLAVFTGITAIVAVLVAVNVRSLPLSVQRSLSLLPLDIEPAARQDAQGTLDWRLEMWRVVAPEVPRYFWFGKGFGYSGTDYYLTQEAMRRGMFQSYEDTLISGNYHNGILTLIIPFGIWGVLAFAWFCLASVRALRMNYRYGDPWLRTINRYILAAFLTRLIFYLTTYGQFDIDLPYFAGLVGLGIALNGGICRAPRAQPVTAEEPALSQPLPQPSPLPG